MYSLASKAMDCSSIYCLMAHRGTPWYTSLSLLHEEKVNLQRVLLRCDSARYSYNFSPEWMATTPPTRFSYSALSNPASWIICANFSWKGRCLISHSEWCDWRVLASQYHDQPKQPLVLQSRDMDDISAWGIKWQNTDIIYTIRKPTDTLNQVLVWLPITSNKLTRSRDHRKWISIVTEKTQQIW
jgi:hypothetical protein